MVTTHPGLFILMIGIGLLVVLISRVARIFAIVVLLDRSCDRREKRFLHDKACPHDGRDCYIELQPVWAGPCMSGDRAGVLKIDGSYYLTAEAGTEASATCLDVRFWQ